MNCTDSNERRKQTTIKNTCEMEVVAIMVSVKGTFHNGVVQLDEPITDREGQTVIITFVEEETGTVASDTVDADREAGWEQLMQSIEQNTMDTSTEELAHQHD